MNKMLKRNLLLAAVSTVAEFMAMCSGVTNWTESKWLHAPDWDGYVFEHVGTRFHREKMPRIRCAFLCDEQNDCNYFFHSPEQCQLNSGFLEYFGKVKDSPGVKPVNDAKCFIKQPTSCYPPTLQSDSSIKYIVSNQRKTFVQAKEYCKNLNCVLAEPRNMQALYDTRPYIVQTFGSDGSGDPSLAFWLGAQYSDQCHNFLWDTDSSIVSSVWFDTEPAKLHKPNNAESHDTDCVVFVPSFSYKSDDYKCNYQMYPLCECRSVGGGH